MDHRFEPRHEGHDVGSSLVGEGFQLVVALVEMVVGSYKILMKNIVISKEVRQESKEETRLEKVARCKTFS